MNYFKIEHSTTKSEIGLTYPQSQIARHSIHTDDKRYIGKQEIGRSLRIDTLPQPVLHPDAKPTDLISNTSMGFRLLISKKMKDILEPYISTSLAEILPVSIHYVDQTLDYWILNPISFNLELIDFFRSEIWLHTVGNAKVKKLSFGSSDEFLEYLNKLVLPERIYIEKAVFLDDISEEYIQIRYAGSGIAFYVSENLRQKMEGAGCTGIKFAELPN